MGGGMGLGQPCLNHGNGNRRGGGDGMMGNQDHDRSQSNFGAGPMGMSNYGQQQQQRPDFDNRGRHGDGRRDNQNWGRQADGGNNGRREDENRRGDRRWDGGRGGRVNDQSSTDWNNQRGSRDRQGGSGFEGGDSFRQKNDNLLNMSLSSGSQNPNGPNFNNVGGGSRQQDQRQHQNMRQNFDNDSEDLNRQFNSRPSERPQASDSWSRYESEGGPGGYDSSNYRTGPPPSSSSTTSRTEEQMRTRHMGGAGNVGAASSSSTSMGGGFMGGREGSTGMGNGTMGFEGKSHQGYRSSGPPPSLGGTTSGPSNMGGASSIGRNGAAMMGGATSMSGTGVPMMGGAPIISEGRRGAMAASGGLPLDNQARGGSFQQCAPNLGQPPPSDARAGQAWAGEQHRQQGGVSSSSA